MHLLFVDGVRKHPEALHDVLNLSQSHYMTTNSVEELLEKQSVKREYKLYLQWKS